MATRSGSGAPSWTHGPSRRSRALRAGLVLLALAVTVAWWLLPPDGRTYRTRSLSFSTGVSGGVYERYGRMLKPDIEADLPGVRVDLMTSAGSVENVRFVATGRRSLTIAAADAIADYRGPGRERLRACARLYDDYVQLLVPAGSKVSSARGLRGLRVAVGQPGSGVNLLAHRLLRAAGLDPTKDIDARPIGIDKAPELLRKGSIDAFFWSGGLPTTSVRELTEELAVRLVPLGDLVEPLRTQVGGSPTARSYYRQAVMPPDAYPKAHPHGDAVSTIAVANLLVTTDRLDDGLVERLTRTLLDSRDRIGDVVHAAQLVDLRTAIYTHPLRLHGGAQRYYRSVKP